MLPARRADVTDDHGDDGGDQQDDAEDEADRRDVHRVGDVRRERHRAVFSGHIVLNRSTPVPATLDALRALPGVGEWTAQVIALRALAWPDAWPASDIGLMHALSTRNVKAIETMAEPWRPWRGYAVARLWNHLETGI